MADKSFFFSSVDQATLVIKEERNLSIYNGIDFWDKVANIRVNSLHIKVTSHRLIISNHNNIENIESKDSNFIYFIIRYNNMKQIHKKYTGIFSKSLEHLKLEIEPNQLVELYSKNLEGPYLQIEAGLTKKEWKIETYPTQQQQKEPEIYQGARLNIIKKQEEVKTTQSTIMSSFRGNVEDLFKNASELQQITRYLKENIKQGNSQEQGEMDQILQKMGCFQIITKDEAGDSYYVDLSKQLFSICQKLFQTMGGLVPLIDLFYAVNKKRGTSLIAPDEILKACKLFQGLGYRAKISTYLQNIKVIEQTDLNPEEDFENRLGKGLHYDQGKSYEDMLKTLQYPPLVLRIKLKIAIDLGKVVVDNRLEGVRYYKNLIIHL